MYAITKRGDHARTWHRPDCAVVKRVPRHVTTELEPEAYRAEREARLSAKFGYEYHDYANNVRCGSCLDRPAPGPAISKSDLRRIFASAREAGLAAARAAVPEPMVIGTPKNMMASLMGQGSEFDPKQPVYVVPEGVCGFAWVTIRPANSAAGHYAENHFGARNGYGGGMQIWISEFGQSYTRKVAYAHAFARSLGSAGISASSGDRLD